MAILIIGAGGLTLALMLLAIILAYLPPKTKAKPAKINSRSAAINHSPTPLPLDPADVINNVRWWLKG